MRRFGLQRIKDFNAHGQMSHLNSGFLHFINLTSAVSRKQYIEILEREVRKYIPNFSYRKSGDTMFDILRSYGDEEAAKKRAQRLRLLYDDVDYASHNPCTMVDILVEKLETI